MAAHSEWGASSAHRWMNCAGSIAAQRGKSDRVGYDAKLGTAAHTVLEMLFTDNESNYNTAYDALGKEINGICMDEETCARVQYATDAINDYYRAQVELHGQENVVVLTETRVYLPHIHKDCFGTADIIIASPSKLIVFDYKNGSGVPVEIMKNEKPNPQVLYYAVGAALYCMKQGYKFQGGSSVPPEITVVICQPARGGTKDLTLSYDDLFDFSTLLSDAVKATLVPNAPRTAGDWCRFCRAAGECGELRMYALEQATAVFTNEGSLSLLPPETVRDDMATHILCTIPTIVAWCKAYQEHRQMLALQGVPTAGFKLVDTKGHRAWNGDEEGIAGQLTAYGAKPADIYNYSLRTPAQVEKAPLPNGIRRSQWEGIISSLSVRPDRGVKLVPADDTRPETERIVSSPFEQESDV